MDTLGGRFVCSLLICGASLALAAVIQNVVIVWSFAGATVAIFIAYAGPALFYLKLRKGPLWKDRHKIYAFALLCGSGVMFVVCTYEAINNVVQNRAGNGHDSPTGAGR